MTLKERLTLIKEVGEEIVTEEELTKLLESGEQLVAYDGFEPSGQMHIGQGILRAINVNKMINAGIKFKMLVSDWTAFCNDKFGGDLEKIQVVGKYFIEVWKAAGMDPRVEYVWASDVVKRPNYWKLVVQIGRTNKLPRFIRTAEFMGREESGASLSAAQIIYPCIQIADIFTLGVNITQLGMDQRKVNMLAREIGPQLGFWKPVVVSHHMLMSLNPLTSVNDEANFLYKNKDLDKNSLKQQLTIKRKMSKSLPDSAIFMTDSHEDVKRKIDKAFCPEGEVAENPVLEYYKYILFEKFPQIVIERPEKYGGSVILNSYDNLEKLFANKEIHPLDIKQTAVKLLNELLQPVREHFKNDGHAHELLKKVQSYQVTR